MVADSGYNIVLTGLGIDVISGCGGSGLISGHGKDTITGSIGSDLLAANAGAHIMRSGTRICTDRSERRYPGRQPRQCSA